MATKKAKKIGKKATTRSTKAKGKQAGAKTIAVAGKH